MSRLFSLSCGIVLGALVALSGCATAPAPQSAAAPYPAMSSRLTIAPLDELEVKVFGVSEFDGLYQVDQDGNIKLPLIDFVSAGGLTSAELARQLEVRLGERYLEDPDVTVRVAETVGQSIAIEGAVNKPGVYPVRGGTSLLQAVAMSGGTSSDARVTEVVVFRNAESGRVSLAYDLKAIREGTSPDPAVFASDVIVVGGSNTRQTYRDFLLSVPLIALFAL